MPELRREAPRNKPGQALFCRGVTFFSTSSVTCAVCKARGVFFWETSFLLAQGIVKWPAVEDMADNDVGVVRVQFNDEWIVRFHVRMSRRGHAVCTCVFCCVFALSRGEDGARTRAGLRVVGGRSAKSTSTASHFCPLV